MEEKLNKMEFSFGDNVVIYESKRKAVYIGENLGHHVAICEGETFLRNF